MSLPGAGPLAVVVRRLCGGTVVLRSRRTWRSDLSNERHQHLLVAHEVPGCGHLTVPVQPPSQRASWTAKAANPQPCTLGHPRSAGSGHPVSPHVFSHRTLAAALQCGPSTALGNHAIVPMIGQPRGSAYPQFCSAIASSAGVRLRCHLHAAVVGYRSPVRLQAPDDQSEVAVRGGLSAGGAPAVEYLPPKQHSCREDDRQRSDDAAVVGMLVGRDGEGRNQRRGATPRRLPRSPGVPLWSTRDRWQLRNCVLLRSAAADRAIAPVR